MKGVELSVNFLVTFVLAIIVFGMGIYIVTTLTNEGFDAAKITNEYLSTQLTQLTCTAADRVCISNNYAKISRRELVVMGVHVYNPLTKDATFNISINATPKILSDGVSINADPSTHPQTFSQAGQTPTYTIDIQPKSQGDVKVAFYIPENASRGQYTYIFNVTANDTSYEKHADRLFFSVK